MTGPVRRKRALPVWAVLLLVVALALLGLGLVDPRDRATSPALGLGLLVTLRVTLVAFVLALVLSTLVALGLVGRRRWLAEALKAYVEVMRGVPMLVLLYYIAFADGQAGVATSAA